MDTLLTKKYPVSKEKFNEVVAEKMEPLQKTFCDDISKLMNEFRDLCVKKQSIYISGSAMYLNPKQKTLFPDLRALQEDQIDNLDTWDMEKYFEEKKVEGHLKLELPTLSQLREKVELLKEVYEEGYEFVCICDDHRSNYLELEVAYNPNTYTFVRNIASPAIIIPIINLKYENYNELLIRYLVPYGMCPDFLSAASKCCLSDLITIYKKFPQSLDLTTENKVIFSGGKYILEEYGRDSDKTWMDDLHWELSSVLKQIYASRNIGEVEMDAKEDLLNCEKIRADIDPYEERLLTDPNRGHWDLWLGQDKSQYTVEVSDTMVARNPVCDINENGVIAIDFGTKSTIVVYQSDIEHSLPMGIGDGNLSKEPSPKRYENPTVMHFVDLDSFLKDYASRKGRPKTKWENLTISHTAMDQFANSKSEEYYEYLHQIKQWAGQREKQFRVQSHNGKTYVLPSFLDLKEDDWNPIEIYAYYIGLYINNMRKGHGIYLDYYLSFPVTYETKIREKIVKSFEKGLKKSLPSSILENEEIMKKFHVNGDISEPAAYAVCALQEYGFEPEEDEEVFYGIFDFGGGTTDFDFGIWKQSTKRRYDYTIENFGAGGDEYLGGENLLEMLAFDVFKENQTMMREKGYTFSLAPKCTEFLGSDSLLADSQEAEKNMHNLMEKIRPYWENSVDTTYNKNGKIEDIVSKIKKAIITSPYAFEIQSKIDSILSDQKDEDDIIEDLTDLKETYELKLEEDSNDTIEFVLTLFDKEGQDHPGEKLTFSKKRLDESIEDRIREGVNNFYSALTLSYQNERVKKPAIFNIFLAGNSCKSPVVRKVFEEAIADWERLIKEKNNEEKDIGRQFDVFPPLGTEDAYKKMESRGINPNRDNFEKPTGKTGVAFGLIQCRAGGTIERISNVGIKDEIPFQYFIGWRSKKKFVLFKDDSKLTKYMGKPDYNEWYRFIEADDSVFDLCYTTLPECISGELMVDGNAAVKRLRCEIDVVDENAFVYIRALDPHTIEYVVAKDSNVEASKIGNIIRKEL